MLLLCTESHKSDSLPRHIDSRKQPPIIKSEHWANQIPKLTLVLLLKGYICFFPTKLSFLKFSWGKYTGNKVAAASPVCQHSSGFNGLHEAVFNYMYLQLVLIKPRSPCVDILAVNVPGPTDLNKVLWSVGCRWIPQGALTLEIGGHIVTWGKIWHWEHKRGI